jgi:hypothetical protein
MKEEKRTIEFIEKELNGELKGVWDPYGYGESIKFYLAMPSRSSANLYRRMPTRKQVMKHILCNCMIPPPAIKKGQIAILYEIREIKNGKTRMVPVKKYTVMRGVKQGIVPDDWKEHIGEREGNMAEKEMSLKAMKAHLSALDVELKNLDEKRTKLYNEKYALGQKYYPMAGSKFIGKCYRSVEGDSFDGDEIKEVYYYKLLKVMNEDEFWAETILIRRSAYIGREYSFSITTYHNPRKAEEITSKEYERQKAKILEVIKKGLKVIKE